MSKRTTRKKQRATKRPMKRLTLKGGFFPSVYGGVTGASMLAPLIARQALRMYNNATPKRRRNTHKRKPSHPQNALKSHPKKTLKNKKSRKNTQ